MVVAHARFYHNIIYVCIIHAKHAGGEVLLRDAGKSNLYVSSRVCPASRSLNGMHFLNRSILGNSMLSFACFNNLVHLAISASHSHLSFHKYK